VDQSRLEQSGFSLMQCGVILDWDRISLKFHQIGSDQFGLVLDIAAGLGLKLQESG